MKFSEIKEDTSPIRTINFSIDNLTKDLSPGGKRNILGLNTKREVVSTIHIAEDAYKDSKNAQEKINDLADMLNAKITDMMFTETEKWLKKNGDVNKDLVAMSFKRKNRK